MPGKFALTYAFLFLVWIAFTGSILFEELLMGAIIVLIISIIASRHFIEGKALPKLNPVRWFYFIICVINQIGREIIAHIKVIGIILSPRLKIEPRVVRLKTPFKSDSALTTLANSITLTPGTLTIDAKDSDLYIHCITRLSEKELLGRSEDILKEITR